MAQLLPGLMGPLGNHGYKLETQSETALTFTRTYRKWYVWVLVVVIFPIGLLFLFMSDTAPIAVVLEPVEWGTVVRVSGVGPPEVERAFTGMVI
jgi:hypothetical protein